MKIPDSIIWEQGVTSFPVKTVPTKPAYSSDGLQVPSSVPAISPNTKVKRISDHTWFTANVANHSSGADWSLRHMYARKQVFNSDNSKIILNSASRYHTILNADGTYYRTANQAQKYPVWANTSPWHIFGTTEDASTILRRSDIRSDDTYTDIITLPYTATIGDSEGDISNDDTKVVLSNNNGGSLRLACVNITAGTYTEINTGRTYADYDWASVSPLGNYVVVAYDNGTRNIDLYTWAGVYVRRITNQQHADLGLDENGDECLYTVGHVEESVGTGVIKSRLSDNNKVVIFGGNNEFPNSAPLPVLDGHVCASCTRWGVPIVIVSAYSSAGGPHVVFGVSTDGSREVYYYGFHNADQSGSVYQQPQANISRDGIYAVTSSNWGNSSDYNELYLMWDDSTTVPAITLDPVNDIELTVGEVNNFQLVGTDPQDDPLTYSLSGVGNPSWVVCYSTGAVQVAPPLSTAIGQYTASFITTDGVSESNVVSMVIDVTEAATGTSTVYPVYTKKVDSANIIAGSGQTFEEDTTRAGYTGAYSLKATAGFNGPTPVITAGVIGRYRQDLTFLPAGNWHMFNRVFAENSSTDSFYSTFDDIKITDQFISDLSGYSWQHLRDEDDNQIERLVSSADGSIDYLPREEYAGLDTIVFVHEDEIDLPSGKLGFVNVGTPDFPIGLTSDFPENLTVTQSASNTINYTIANPHNHTYTVTSINSSDITVISEVEGTIVFKGESPSLAENLQIVVTEDSSGESITFTCNIIIESNGLSFPAGFSTTIPAAITITKDDVETINFDITNVNNFETFATPSVSYSYEIEFIDVTSNSVTFKGIEKSISASLNLHFIDKNSTSDSVIYPIAITVIGPDEWPEGITLDLGAGITVEQNKQTTIPITYTNTGSFTDVSFTAEGEGGIQIVSVSSTEVVITSPIIGDQGAVKVFITENGSNPPNVISEVLAVETVEDIPIWPQNIDANLASQAIVNVGDTLHIYSNQVNLDNFVLLADRWSAPASLIPDVANDINHAAFLTTETGQATIYYTMQRVSDNNNAQVFSRTINIIGEGEVAFILAEVGTLSFYTNTSISFQFFHTGGTDPVVFTSSTLPVGLSLSSSGLLTGTATTVEELSVTVTATDADNTVKNITVVFDLVAPYVADVFAVGTIKCADVVVSVEVSQSDPLIVKAYQDLNTKYTALDGRISVLEGV